MGSEMCIRDRGKATATAETLKRWAEDEWRYSPYQYSEELLLWKDNHWRCLNSNERIRMLGFPSQYLNVKDASPEDTRCELAGDAMAVQVLVRMQRFQRSLGLVVDDQGPPSQPEESPSSAIRQGIALSGWSNEAGDEAEPVVHDEVPLWAIEGQQGLTPKQMGKARWVCVCLLYTSPSPRDS